MKFFVFCTAAVSLFAACTVTFAATDDGGRHLVAENSFTDSVVQGYQDIRSRVTETFGGYAGDPTRDAQNFQKQLQKDREDLRKAVQDARNEYRHSRQEEQESYRKYHQELPTEEDIEADIRQYSH
jgi:uncharacterized protein YukE